MADYNSSLPIRTEADGDAVVKIVGKASGEVAEVNASDELLVKDQDAQDAVDAVATALVDGTQKSQTVDADGDVMAVNDDGSINVNVVDTQVGDQKHIFDTAPTIAPNTPTDVIDYTVTALKTFLLKEAQASASGKIKVEIECGGVLVAVGFNSTSNPNVVFNFPSPVEVVAGDAIKVIVTNKDNSSSDLYAFINGTEV